MISLILWLQQIGTPSTADLFSDEVRTVFLGAILAVVGYIARTAGTVRDDVHNIKRDVPELRKLLQAHEREIRWLTAKRIAQEAMEQAERDHYQGTDRRHHLRRDRDIVNEALAAEMPYSDKEEDPHE
jgi:hypothetical protein